LQLQFVTNATPPQQTLCRSSALNLMAAQPQHNEAQFLLTARHYYKMAVLYQMSATGRLSAYRSTFLAIPPSVQTDPLIFCPQMAAHSNKQQVLYHVVLTPAADSCLSFSLTKITNVTNVDTCRFSHLLATEAVFCERR
jgi:hypothetical protein